VEFIPFLKFKGIVLMVVKLKNSLTNDVVVEE